MTRSFDGVDPLVLGHRVRHFRRRAGLTLAQLGERIGRPVPFLSQLENGKVEARLTTINDLADALGTTALELLDAEAPNRRAALEIALERAQRHERFGRLGLPPLRVTAKIPDEVLEHLVELHGASELRSLADEQGDREPVALVARRANAELRREMRATGNYLERLERLANRLLKQAGYAGHGPVSDRVIAGIAAALSYGVERVAGLPRSARSVTDRERRVISIRERDDLPMRAARMAVVQALAHLALEHDEPDGVREYLRQRVDANYLAAAILCPEAPAVALLKELDADGDLSCEDLKETFYLSYEVAAHRFTNLATRHLDMPVHFLRTEPNGTIRKAYENDGLPLPSDGDGGIEGQRVPRGWSARRAWESAEPLFQQHTRLAVGDFFCSTYVETEGGRSPHAISLGTTKAHARRFRGSGRAVHVDATGPAGRAAPPIVPGTYSAIAAEHSHALSAPTPGSAPSALFSAIDDDSVEEFVREMRRRSATPRRGA